MGVSTARKLCGELLDSRLGELEADLRRIAATVVLERKRIPRLHDGQIGDSAGHIVGRVMHEITTILANHVSGLASAAGEFDLVVARNESHREGAE
ncbi:hypothetical protein [Kutzneria sp. 744]|uniref:hypothetical protein n=1 Tax=Kutzneria sp. (strain 744) TaxID=345341 RepID=UPI0003EEBF86|nr:hypothetical protein [Kutzneria sp. 744]EWM19651.1 hypothetical protein KUTG_09955 [Kutzneria sp. 744]